MNVEYRWVLLLAIAASAAVGAVVASKSHRRHRRIGHAREDTTEFNSWENEGGNVVPAPAPPVLP